MPSIPASAIRALPVDLTPSALILARADACRAGDFAFVYDSYYEDSNFRRHFSLRHEYLAYALEELVNEVVLHECRVLRERVAGHGAAVLFYQHIDFRGDAVETLEVAHLKLTAAGWRFDYGEKLDRAQVTRSLDDLDWDDFTHVPGKVIF